MKPSFDFSLRDPEDLGQAMIELLGEAYAIDSKTDYARGIGSFVGRNAEQQPPIILSLEA